MFDNKTELETKIHAGSVSLTELKSLIKEKTLDRLLQVVEEFAPNESSFDEAVYVDGPDPDQGHSLITVENELANFMRENPLMADAMRDSIEFDTTDRPDEFQAAARAAVNECFDDFREQWERNSANRIHV